MSTSVLAFGRRKTATLCCSVLITIFIFAVAGCGQKSTSSQESEPSGPLQSVDPATVGSINGTVTIEGSYGGAGVIAANCGKAAPPAANDENNGELAKTVVYVKTGLAKYRYDTAKEHIVLDQKGCTYEPQIVALMTHQPLELRNDDPVAHNIHVLAKVNRPWDHSEPAGVPPIIESFSKPELAIHVICKIHAGMSAFLFVFDNPYYAIPSPAGTFELKNVPPGRYTIEAWQEHLGIQDQTVTISPNQSKMVSFVFKAGNSKGD